MTDKLRYIAVYSLPALTALSFTSEGVLTLVPVLYIFLMLPILELFLKPNTRNDSREVAAIKAKDAWYDFLLVLAVPVQYGFGLWFLFVMREPALETTTLIGRISAYGLMCGVFGINVAHELGHHPNRFHQFLSKALLLTSLYTHFYIEHNRGHHRNVATHNDPSTARLNEPVYFFWFRSSFQSWVGAWKLELNRMKRKKRAPWSLHNEMVRFTLLQLGFVGLIYSIFGGSTTHYYILSAVIGFLLLETVNYIEHYGLAREKVSEFRYENAGPEHSWNSSHPLGRVMLFELSRHSDHHYQPAKKYPTLNHWDGAPQMPTGYPGMMILALISPLWFAVMNKRVAHYRLQSDLNKTTGIELN